MHRPDPTRSDGRRAANGDGAQAAPLLLPVAADALAPLIEAVVEATLRRVEAARPALPDKLAFAEAEAARLLSLNPWQLRGERRLGRVRARSGRAGRSSTRGEALVDYLASRPWEGGT